MTCGTGEMIVLVVVVLIVLSASRMGAVGNALGKFVYSFKKASKGEGFVDGKATRKKLDRDGVEDAQVIDDRKKR
jgi:sec-independent protein translocase protein TatA